MMSVPPCWTNTSPPAPSPPPPARRVCAAGTGAGAEAAGAAVTAAAAAEAPRRSASSAAAETADSLRTDRKAFPAAGTPTAEAGICRITAVPGFAATAGRRAADAGKGRLGTAGTGQDSRAAVTTRGIEIPGAKRRTADAAATAGPVEKRDISRAATAPAEASASAAALGARLERATAVPARRRVTAEIDIDERDVGAGSHEQATA